MFKILGKNVLRTSAFALACFALAGPSVKAATISYSTQGLVPDPSTSSSTINGTPDISFVGVQSGTFNAPSAAGLGSFQVAKGTVNSETDYNNTPFSITFVPTSVAGTPTPANTSVTIHGFLNGSIMTDALGNQSSSVVATFTPLAPTDPASSFVVGGINSTLSVLNSPLNLVPYSAGGQTTVQAQLVATASASSGSGGTNPTPTPEPTTLAILGTAIVGLGLRHRLRSGRQVA